MLGPEVLLTAMAVLAVHAVASVIVTVYEPPARLLRPEPVVPFDQL